MLDLAGLRSSIIETKEQTNSQPTNICLQIVQREKDAMGSRTAASSDL